ncbi:MAG: DoxX family protein [Gammaproteobacteria bacterium]
MNNIFQNDDIGKLIMRLMIGFLMLFHGVAKIINLGSLEFIQGQLLNNSLPEILVYGVYIGEILAPLMIILGVFTRVGGLIIFVNMIFAIYLVHAHELVSLGQHGGWAIELQGLYLFGALAIMFLGSGNIAVRPD